MVEPLEDTRSELTFVTELVSTSLHNVLLSATGAGARRSERDRHRPPGTEPSGEVDLDEVEIQKGTLQIAKGLGFLHQQAKMVHLNLTPEAVLINAKVSEWDDERSVWCVLRAERPGGDWKLASDRETSMECRSSADTDAGRLEAVRTEFDDTTHTTRRDTYKIHLPRGRPQTAAPSAVEAGLPG